MVQTGAFLYALIGYHTKPCKIMVQDTIFVSFVTSIHSEKQKIAAGKKQVVILLRRLNVDEFYEE